ncbi:MAG: hypothetical protein PHG08_01800 [Bacilli bacterium]|nr:hypothetical protein [Bacilli bacterium]HHU24169.1 hypothetical protein [Acholeplasmataceae bacterium]
MHKEKPKKNENPSKSKSTKTINKECVIIKRIMRGVIFKGTIALGIKYMYQRKQTTVPRYKYVGKLKATKSAQKIALYKA